MKRMLSLISVCVLLMLSVVTASAENLSKFNLKLVSENDSQAVFVLDFEGGTPFSALDFKVVTNEKKAKVTAIVDGQGLINFKQQADAAISQANVETTPAMVTVAMIPGYRNVKASALFEITVAKLEKEKLTAKDVVIEITNCADNNFQAIETSVTTDLGATTESDKSTVASSTASTDATVASTEDSGSTTELTENNTEPQTDAQAESQDSTDGKEPNTAAIIVVCVVAVAVVAGAVIVIIKKKTGANKEG